MGWISGIAVYTVLWWLVLFCILPIGIERVKAEPEPGHDPGAPANPRLVLKVFLTTAIAAALFVVVYLVINSGWISFRPS